MSDKPLPHDFVSIDFKTVAELRAEIERLEAQNAHLKRLLRFKAQRSMGSSDPVSPVTH